MMYSIIARRVNPSVRGILALMMLLCLFPVCISAQAKYRPEIAEEYHPAVFVVTNRLLADDGQGRRIFTNEVDTASPLKYMKVTFQDDEWFSEAYSSLDEMLAQPAPYSDWAVWAHGDGQSFLLSMKRALEIQHLHEVNFIVFSWPTQAPDKGPIGNFKNSRENAHMTVPYLRGICMELQAYRAKQENRMQGENLSIFFHSLANYLLQLSIEQGVLDNIEQGLFDNLILNAPAVASQGHNQWVDRLDIQERIFIAFNDEDINLEGLRVFSSLGVQLGERPLNPLAENAVYVDFTKAVGSRAKTGATHSYYYDLMTELSPNIREFYRDLFHGRKINFHNPGKFFVTDEKQIHQIKF